jgi:hypothetical protein
MTEESAWIEWKGGDCPIPPDTPFQVKLRNGETAIVPPNQEWRWTDSGSSHDIVAYRLVSPTSNVSERKTDD